MRVCAGLHIRGGHSTQEGPAESASSSGLVTVEQVGPPSSLSCPCYKNPCEFACMTIHNLLEHKR